MFCSAFPRLLRHQPLVTYQKPRNTSRPPPQLATDHETGLGETRTPTSLRTSAPKADASANSATRPLREDRSLTVAHPSLVV